MADRAQGSFSQLVYGEETIYGVPPSPFNGKLLSSANYAESVSGTKERLVPDTITSARARQEVIHGNETVSGSVPFTVAIEGFPSLIKHVLGPSVVTGSGPYTHIIKRGALPIGMHLEKQFLNIATPLYLPVSGVKWTSFTFSVNTEGLITGTGETVGKKFGPLSTGALEASPTIPAVNSLSHKSVTSEEGGVSAELAGFEMTITNNIDNTDRIIGDTTIQTALEGMGEVTGTIIARFTDDTLLNKWFNEVESSVKLNLTWPASLGSMEILVPSLKYADDLPIVIPSAQGINVPMTFQGYYNSTEQSDVVITVVNNEPAL